MKNLLLLVSLVTAKRTRNSGHNGNSRFQNGKRPNIIIFVLDDQDVQLRSQDVMVKTQEHLIDKGVKFNNAFTTTPTCCPSRSSMLTGLYAHNHHVMTNNENCTGAEWIEKFEPRTYGAKLQEKDYKTAFFGKYLNEYNGTYVADFDKEKRSGLQLHSFGDKPEEYFTDVIVDNALEYFETHADDAEPLLMVLNFPAPHGPEDAHPDYRHVYDQPNEFQQGILGAHRDLVFNKTSWQPGEKHWFIASQKEMNEDDGHFTDLLQRRRLQTLFSVDNGIESIMKAVEARNQMDNTYFMYTSDHGYHLGQFGVVKGKALPYDFDSRIPFYMRGPSIPRGELREEIVLNIDLMPTILDIAGFKKEAERDLDGTSILKVAKGTQDPRKWRKYFLIERGKFPNNMLFSKPNKQEYLSQLCRRKKMQTPIDGQSCQPKQTHYCTKEGDEWKISKCKNPPKLGITLSADGKEFCCCYECYKRHQAHCARRARSRRAIFSPAHFPMTFKSNFCDVPQKSCTCEKRQKTTSSKHISSPQRRKNPVNQMKNELDKERSQYKDMRDFHKSIRNQHNKRGKRKGGDCKQRGMACFTVDDQTFQTHPKWDRDEQCYCINASNGTFFCLRHLSQEENERENYLYCEFITGEQEFYDLETDKNAELNLWNLDEETIPDSPLKSRPGKFNKLKERLPGLKDKLFNCQGTKCKEEIEYGNRAFSNRRSRNNNRRSLRRKNIGANPQQSTSNHRNCSFFREKSRSLHKMATSCGEIYQSGCMTTGRYYIRVGNRRRIPVLCDMDTDGGGWTVVHSHGVRHPEEFRCYKETSVDSPTFEGRKCRRAVGQANWNSTWEEYIIGFGEIPSAEGRNDFWLGLDNIFELSNAGRGTEARIELYNWGGERSWAKYGTFMVSDIDFGYRLTVKNFEDNKDLPVHDAFSGVTENFLCRGRNCPNRRENRQNSKQNGQMFTTKDRDNDNYCRPTAIKRDGSPEYKEEDKACEMTHSNTNCAIEEQSGFWFNSCSAVNLNGPIYRTNPERERQKALPAGMIWATWQKQTSLMFSSIKLRPRNFNS
ncbi:Oidioi.mRNA.OKI2018_I69.chr1.g2891.t1.cds [Oikopleura dioica]|uniref:Oidioi.mRNA.OKI2018_I69.chr1.g2891.t1.cds n=1 Tax=Oikopleura dioica TaxID=34765 RepID=A0ABN7SXS5_OIKDI|nr:Oidioi.mRNA.OKI2018_I69.chr1.g2891.t1.cds [Oikopleura dioica]